MVILPAVVELEVEIPRTPEDEPAVRLPAEERKTEPPLADDRPRASMEARERMPLEAEANTEPA